MTDTYTTREVAKEIGVPLKTLQLWVREGHLSPQTTGNGKQRRIHWTAADVDAARKFSTDKAQSKRARDVRDMLLDILGHDAMRALIRAIDMPCPHGSVIAAGPDGARAARLNEPVSSLLRRIGGRGVILPQQ